MENKGSGAARPLGTCEKLFNALHLNLSFHPLRRIAYHSQEPTVPKPASLPSDRSAVGDSAAPPTSKSSGSECAGGAAVARQVSDKKVLEPKLSKVESQSSVIPLRVPSKVEPLAAAAFGGATATPSKKLSYVGPQPPPPSPPMGAGGATTAPSKKLSYVEPQPPPAVAAGGATATPSKKLSYVEPQPPLPSWLPTERVPNSSGKPPAPAPPPDMAVSKTDSIKATVDNTKPASAAEVGRIRTRRNLNDRVDEYINRTMNKLRTASNAGGSSSTSK